MKDDTEYELTCIHNYYTNEEGATIYANVELKDGHFIGYLLGTEIDLEAEGFMEIYPSLISAIPIVLIYSKVKKQKFMHSIYRISGKIQQG